MRPSILQGLATLSDSDLYSGSVREFIYGTFDHLNNQMEGLRIRANCNMSQSH